MMGATEGCSGTGVPSAAASLACPEVTALGWGRGSTWRRPVPGPQHIGHPLPFCFVPIVWSLKKNFSRGLQRPVCFFNLLGWPP